MLDGLTSNVSLEMDFLKQYNPTVSWLDCQVGIPCLVQNGCGSKSSTNSVGETVDNLHGNMSTCSNGVWCCD